MTDKEKSTNDRVQQEYSMDPRYSVIVSNECLFNVSCVPEADSYTLVKIFGSVSEDGQTVSGLSGSSLAELMLKPSLETAPVFSLDGNTTKDFQHNFIRVFTARGIPAVLETNQENHQTYQVMNQLEEVTGYQIPQRPVDHSTQYDHQQILILEDNPAVRTAATYLFEKHPKVSSVYVLDNNQRPVLIRGDSVPLTEESRLVLVGHGRKDNSGEMRLGGYEVQEVSKIIQQTSRDSNKIKTISVVACDVGSDNAFIETLLKDLHETAGIETELHLRDAVLQVSHTGEKITLEITKDGEQWRHKDDSKKVVATLDRNGDVIIRNEPGSKGKEIFTTERNFLGPENRFLVYRDSWPVVPRRFINKNVLGKFTDADKIFDIAKDYMITELYAVQDYETFKTTLDISDYPASGRLGGYNDGHITSQDLKSASELEKSFKLESYYSRLRVLSAEQIHSQLKAKYGESLAGLHVQEGSARMENGEFVCHLLDGANAKLVEFRAKLSAKSQRYSKAMSESIETAVHDMENHGSISSHQGSKYVEHAGHAVGTLGLMLGLKGAVRAFEQGDIKDGLVGSLQTAHGVTAMTTSVIAKQALSSEARMAKAVTSVMKSPAIKRFTSVIPIVGIGFGIYNFEQDLERGDALGYIDASLDGSMVVLDVIETAVPELAPFIAPINLALSVVRMGIDEIYMAIQNELNNLPKDAGLLEKLRAVSLGFLKGIEHFGISLASFFYNWHYDEIEQGHRLVEQISDYHKYYEVTKQQDGTSAVDFSSGDSSWNGGGVHFCLADQGPSELCMDYFVSSDESFGKRCWQIDTQGSKDIILGLGESHQLEYTTLEKKILMFIPAGSVTVVSDNKADCLDRDQFTKCIKSSSIDYSSSSCPLLVDLQEDEAFSSVTEVRGSKFNDDIRGNKEHNVIVPGRGHDFIQGRGGEDWYVITPGQGVKTINNQSPDLALDILFLKEEYENIMCSCEGQSIIILVHGRIDVILQNWFDSKFHQHLQIKTSDGITSGLMTNRSSCDESLMFPVTVDFRNQTPSEYKCFIHNRNNSQIFCSLQGKRKMNGKVMNMKNRDSVKEMYGSSGFDIMVGNSNENLLDPYTGGALMIGGEGKDTYIIKQGYGNNSMIANFAEDQSIDTVSVDMDYLHGSQVTLDSSTEDLEVTITSKGEQLKFILLNYAKSSKHQHLEFQSSDGVNFKLKSLNSTGDVPFIYIEAFKVTLKQLQVDCRLDLNSQRNLSKVQTVQGCPSQSNDILGNDQDNALIGGWKDDALEGGAGDDTLIGGNGDDLLIGGLGDDTLYGEDGNDTMMGNSGRDVFLPGPGADLVDGGPGRDTVVYRGDPDTGKGVYVNLLTGQGRYADAEGDVLKDVEIVIGTIYSDILVSGYESSLLKGSDGNDILVSTGGDYLVGGDGNDIYMLAFNNGSVTVDNCAKDNATDVLYISSQLTLPFDCQLLSDRVLLTSFGLKQTTIKITLQGWISDENECGHLKLGFRDQEVSVDRLLQECQLRQK
ncbi:hypothetical protein PFLUV_G00077410 [Perca fluviatilis]|uniref:Peptidase C80 domain-containing protein n=1 Tax=Perca fluviatilis TaxID=8168 RepID=A0A6A5F878_PERFL|nr:hypothetical protein PFLUV_G00077410 [Perca fluviatilis]